jgi:hypothetical protein
MKVEDAWGRPCARSYSWLKDNLVKLLDTREVDLTEQEKQLVWEAYGRIRRAQEPAPR